MKKMLVVLDHYDADMFKVVNKKAEGNFLHSVVGSILSNKVIGHPKTGLDTKDTTVDLKFFYTDKVPPRNKYTNAVIKPSASILHKKRDEMVQYILDTKPDIVVSYGSWFKNELTSLYKLPKDMFELIPFKLPQSDFTTYLVFNPSLKQQFFLGSYERDKMIISNRMVNRFLKGGIESTKPQFGKYRLVTNYHEVERIFNEVLPKYPIIALDFETNTLETYRKGAKAIMVSMSWEEHQGVSIPLNHRLSPNLWTKEQFDSIINMIKELMMKEQRKVLHNCIYDIHMMMDIYGLEYATNCVDTMLMYYETVDENQGAQRGLKHLAYKYTDMGGYEDERDQAIEQYLKNDYDRWYSAEMEKYEKGERSRKPSKTQYTAPTNQVDGGKVDFEWLPMETIYKYASADTDVTLQLYHIFDKKVKSRPKWIKFCYEFFPQLCDTLAYMQHTGFQMDMDKMEEYREHFTNDIEEVTKKMYEVSPEIQEYENHNLALLQEREQIKAIKPTNRTPEQKEKFKEYGKLRGEDTNGIPKYKFNPGSSEKIGYVLYHMLGYKLPADKEYLKPKAVQSRKLSHPEKLTWKDYKTDRNSALPYIKKTYHAPLVDLLLAYSNDKKMISSTIEGYSKLADATGKLHTTFHPTGTVTSRLASSGPNLQNVKKPTSNVNDPNYNYSAKGLFKSRFKGGYIFNIDYKSLEIFVSSLISKDIGMMQALMDGADIHKRNASLAFNIPVDEVDSEHRYLAKAVSFGLLYGESPQGLSDSRGLTLEEAQQVYDKVLSAMPQMQKAIEVTEDFVEQRGYVETIAGHVRRLPEATQNLDYGKKSRAIRQSFNAVVQGSGSYCTNTALIIIRNTLRKYDLKSRIAITVHDSIVLDVHPDEINIVPAMAKKIMEHLPIQDFILNINDFPTLKIADKYKINDTQFRFPLFGEIAFGKTYGDDLDFDFDDYKALGIDKYYQFSMECKYIEDKANTDLSNEEDNDKKAEIVKQRDQQLEEIRNKYFKKVDNS